MNYVFDVCLNFNKELYNYYEWDKDDEVLYFLKIPVFKIEEELIRDFINNDIKVDNIFLKKIYNKSQIYFKKNNKKYNYSCIITTSKKCIGINFDKNGYILGKSYLSLEEETEVIEFSKFIKYSIVNYKILRRYNFKEKYLTRKEQDDIKIIREHLDNLEKKNMVEELKYLCYEIFDYKINNYKQIKEKLDTILTKNDKKREKFLEIIKFVY